MARSFSNMADGKKLWLELGLDLTDFDAAFANADKTAKQKQKMLNDTLSKVNKSFEIQINNAKLAGDSERALALDTERLAAKVDILKRAEENLAKVRDSARRGGNAKQIAAAEKQYQDAIIRRQKMELAYKQQTDRAGVNGIGNALKSLVQDSKYGGLLTTITSNAESLTAASSALGVALSGPVALGFGAAAAAGVGFKKAIDAVEESALKAAQDGKEVYRIMSMTGMKQSDAERFGDAFAIAGESADTALQSLMRLNKAMEEAGENGTKLTAALEKYGVNLYDKDGHLKKYEEQLLALSDAYKTAKEAGLGQEFAAEIFSGRAGAILPVLEKWEEAYKMAGDAGSTGFMQAGKQTELLMRQKQLENIQRHTESRFGDIFTEPMLKHMERSVKMENEHAEAINKSKENYEELERIVDRMLEKYDSAKSFKDKALHEAEQIGIGILANLFDREGLEEGIKKEVADLEKYGGLEGLIKARVEAEVEVKEKPVDADRAKKVAELKERDKAAKQAEQDKKAAAEREKLQKKQAAEAEKLQKEQLAKQKQAIQERENAEKRINSILQSSYQNRLQQIEQEKQAWIKAGADRVNATLAAEKQITDARKSEAEKALTSQKDLWRAYMKMGDTQEFQDYALKKNMRSMGISKKDYESMNVNALEGFINAMNKFKNNTWLSQLNGSGGFGAIENGFMNAMDKVKNNSWLSQLNNDSSLSAIGGAKNNQTPVNNEFHIEVKLDNVVVEDMGTIERLANKVSDAIIPEVKKAIDGGAAYGY